MTSMETLTILRLHLPNNSPSSWCRFPSLLFLSLLPTWETPFGAWATATLDCSVPTEANHPPALASTGTFASSWVRNVLRRV